jgi:hypothetical protein
MDFEEIRREDPEWINFNHTRLLTTQVAYKAGDFLATGFSRRFSIEFIQMNSDSDDKWQGTHTVL